MIGEIKHPYNAKVTAQRLLNSCKEEKITAVERSDYHCSKLVNDLSITNAHSHTVSLM